MDEPRPAVPLVVIGGSAGAIRPLRQIIGSLPPTLEAAVGVVVHVPDDSPSGLARLLARTGALPVAFAEHGQAVDPGRVVVAPPGHHLLVHDGRLVLSRGARENGTRPAIDPLFRSAARAAGRRSVSVLLSGTLDDGVAGTAAVRQAGGTTLAQDPADAEFPDMPGYAIAAGVVDEVLPAAAISERIAALVAARGDADPRRPAQAGGRPAAARLPESAVAISTVDRGLAGPAEDLPGVGSPYSCPACGGVLYERKAEGGYLCRLGHRYSHESLRSGQESIVEDALWTALRTLDETASLAARVRDRAATRGDRGMELRFETRRAGAQARADRIRELLRGAERRDGDALFDAGVEHGDPGTSQGDPGSSNRR